MTPERLAYVREQLERPTERPFWFDNATRALFRELLQHIDEAPKGLSKIQRVVERTLTTLRERIADAEYKQLMIALYAIEVFRSNSKPGSEPFPNVSEVMRAAADIAAPGGPVTQAFEWMRKSPPREDVQQEEVPPAPGDSPPHTTFTQPISPVALGGAIGTATAMAAIKESKSNMQHNREMEAHAARQAQHVDLYEEIPHDTAPGPQADIDVPEVARGTVVMHLFGQSVRLVLTDGTFSAASPFKSSLSMLDGVRQVVIVSPSALEVIPEHGVAPGELIGAIERILEDRCQYLTIDASLGGSI